MNSLSYRYSHISRLGNKFLGERGNQQDMHQGYQCKCDHIRENDTDSLKGKSYKATNSDKL